MHISYVTVTKNKKQKKNKKTAHYTDIVIKAIFLKS